MNAGPPSPRTGIPILGGRTEQGFILRGEPIMYFDREEFGNPRARLAWRLQQRNWHPNTIESFLDRLGFKE